VSHALDIPYVVAEASVAPKQRHGAWALDTRVGGGDRAAAATSFNPVDLAGVRAVRGPARG
jgi:hypothetical protein